MLNSDLHNDDHGNVRGGGCVSRDHFRSETESSWQVKEAIVSDRGIYVKFSLSNSDCYLRKGKMESKKILGVLGIFTCFW